jgi:hypothetical protein
MVINFRARRISRGAHKLVRTLTLIIIKRFDLFIIYIVLSFSITYKTSFISLIERSSIRVSQTSDSPESYMVVNFRARGISRDACKLTRTLTLIIIIKIDLLFVFLNYLQNKFHTMSRNPRYLSQFFIHHQC